LSDPVVQFDAVSKHYHVGTFASAGLKNVLLHLPKTIRQWRERQPVHALNNVSFDIQRGEFFGIVGYNGSGKSTALGLIAGVLTPTAGRVACHGHICPLLELGAGFHPELTGMENVFLNGALLGMTRRQIRQRLGSILVFAGLEHFIHEPIRTYSSGMVARLGFAVAVNLDPQILLVDEVLAVGDEKFQLKCHEKLDHFRKQGITTVFVSHDTTTVAKMSDRVAWLHRGELAAIGDPQEVVDRYHHDQPEFELTHDVQGAGLGL